MIRIFNHINRRLHFSSVVAAGTAIKSTRSQDVLVNTRHRKCKAENRQPFAKGFFLGKIDVDLLTFPEAIASDQLKELDDNIRLISESLSHKNGSIAYTQLANSRMFGLNVPQHLSGSGYFETETQYVSELGTRDYQVGVALNNHRIVADLLLEFGSEEQKTRMLPQMASGDKPATIAIFEDNEATSQFQTTATLNVDEKTWKVRGSKPRVVNAANAEWFLVGAQLEYRDYSGECKEGLAFFLVDRHTQGVSVVPDSSGNDSVASLHLDDVVVSADNVLGSYEQISDIGMRLLSRSRLYSGHLATGLMRKLLHHYTESSGKRQLGQVPLSEKALYQERSGRVCSEIFAIESAVYFTLGLLDEYQCPDIELECALIKSYASKQALERILDTLNSTGCAPTFLTHALDLQTSGESLDALRLYVGLLGLQFAGVRKHNL